MHRSIRTAAQLTLAVSMLVGGFPLVAQAQDYIPPDRGLPGRREGGGTRGCWSNTAVPTTQNRVTALVPAQNFGYTLAEYPTFFVYIPAFFAQKAVGAEFILRDDQGNQLHQANFPLNNTAGIVSISLPSDADLPPLEVGKDYQWSFALICDPTDASGNVVVDSWIQRIEPTSELSTQLAQATPQELPALYASAGVWYDAIASLSQLQVASAHPTALTRWRNLLNSVGLNNITSEMSAQALTISQLTEVQP